MGFYKWCLSRRRWIYATLELPERFEALDSYLKAPSEARSEFANNPTPADRGIAVAFHDADLSTPEMVIADQAHNLVSLERSRDSLSERCRNDGTKIRRRVHENANVRTVNE